MAHLGASEVSWPTRQGFDELRVGVFESTDGTLYREGMQCAGLPEAAIAAAEPYILESEANGNVKKVRPYTVAYRRQIESDIAAASVEFIERQAKAKQPFFLYVGFTHTHYPTLAAPEFTGSRASARMAMRLWNSTTALARCWMPSRPPA
jgi:Sulfatase